MKRGFLLGSKNDSKTSPSSCLKHDVDTSRVTNPANKPRESLKIPFIPDYDDVPYLERPHVRKITMIPTPLPTVTGTGTEPFVLALLYPGAKEALEPPLQAVPQSAL